MVTSEFSPDSVVVLNPVSGTGSHRSRVRDLAADRGFVVRETQRPEHGVDLASEAVANGARLVAAAGGDGTLNEVIRGVMAADGLDTVTVGIIPCGTGNGFARTSASLVSKQPFGFSMTATAAGSTSASPTDCPL